MRVRLIVPEIPASRTDATLLAWHKAPGDKVDHGEILADLQVDDLVVKISAPTAGVLAELGGPTRHSLQRGDVLAAMETEAGPQGIIEPALKGFDPVADIDPGPGGPIIAAIALVEQSRTTGQLGDIDPDSPGGPITKEQNRARPG